MAKRQRNQRTVGNMLPYGRPETVERGVLVQHKGRDGRVLWTTETIVHNGLNDVGRPDDTRVDPVKRTKDFHHDDCHGKKGVDAVFWRDGRYYCQSCYEFRYGSNPWLEPELWGREPEPPALPLTIRERQALLESRKES